MGKEISVKADLTGCSIVFLVPTADDGLLDVLSFKAIQAIFERGINVRTMTMIEATEKLVEFQQTPGHIPAEQKFLKVTPQGSVIQLFR